MCKKHSQYEPRRGKITTKKEQRSRTHLFISLTISISNHIQSLLIIHVSSIIVRVDRSTIHVPGNDAHGTIAENTPNAMGSVPKTPLERGELTFELGECRFGSPRGTADR